MAFVNATVWTCAEAGMLERATVLIESGKIVAVGKDLELPEGIKTIDCADNTSRRASSIATPMPPPTAA